MPCISHEDVCPYMHFFVYSNPHLLTPGLSTTSARHAVTKFEMPAMSPTMTEGGISSWKKREGDSFTAGDVLLEIVCSRQFLYFCLHVDIFSTAQETDKAVIDVEAQDDGIVGKILVRFLPVTVPNPNADFAMYDMTGSRWTEEYSRRKGHRSSSRRGRRHLQP
jgi:hypothetical protein